MVSVPKLAVAFIEPEGELTTRTSQVLTGSGLTVKASPLRSKVREVGLLSSWSSTCLYNILSQVDVSHSLTKQRLDANGNYIHEEELKGAKSRDVYHIFRFLDDFL